MTDAPREPLDPPRTARLTEFARSCGAAARAVSLYPAGHPAVATALTRLGQVAAGLTTSGPFYVTVLPDGLLLDGLAPARPDQALTDLARLLHRHQVNALTLRNGGGQATWHSLLRLLARPTDELREAGGIGHLWSEHGGLTNEDDRRSIELREVDYERLLRHRALGDPITVAEIFEGLLAGNLDALGDDARAVLAEIVRDQDRVEILVAELANRTDDSPAALAGAVTTLLRAAGAPDAETDPSEAIANLARVLSGLTAEQMAALLRRRGTEEATANGVDVIQAAADAMTDEQTVAFAAGSITTEHGASLRLAEALQALVPDIDERRQLVSLVGQQMAGSPFGQTDEFPDIWKRAEKLLTSYSDEQYVHEQYARELNVARSKAVEVEEIGDDPAERVEGWLSTVDDPSLHQLDVQLLLDLLRLERDPHRWRDIAATCVRHVDTLALTGDLVPAVQLAEAMASARAPAGETPPRDSVPVFAVSAMEKLAAGPAIGHALTHLRGGDDRASDAVTRLCRLLGPSVVSGLADALATERDARVKRTVRDILVGFGAEGREAVRALLDAPDWEVRQTAALLLRQFGGSEGLDELRRLLNDAEPLVQREAMGAMIQSGDERAYQVLTEVLSQGRSRHRDTLIQELTSQRDERAVPLCRYLLTHLDHRSAGDVYLAAIEALGAAGGAEAIEPLEQALYAGEWWAPFRTRALRKAAAQALRRTRLPEAAAVLRRAAADGPRGVRAAAGPQVAQLEAQS